MVVWEEVDEGLLAMEVRNGTQDLPRMGRMGRPLRVGPGRGRPARSRKVGTMSITVQKAGVMLGWENDGCCVGFAAGLRIRGTRQPPSVENILYSLLGAVAACAQRAPYQTKESLLPMLARLLS